MGNAINHNFFHPALDFRNDQMNINGEEFLSLPVAMNQHYKYIICDWDNLSNFTKKRLIDAYKVNPAKVKYAVISKASFSNYKVVIQMFDFLDRPCYLAIVDSDKALTFHYSNATQKFVEHE